MNKFKELLLAANCKNMASAVALGAVAISKGDDPAYVVACLRRNQPGLFYTRARR